jgi:peptide/nickel transport system substrate-binding protein
VELDRLVLTRRRLLAHGAKGSALVALGPLLAACGSSGGSSSPSSSSGSGTTTVAGGSSATGTPKSGGTLTFARSVAPTQLDPANSIIAGDVYTLDKIFEPLYVTSPAGQLTRWLATGYTASADHLTWSFQLRSGVRFSDGTPLRAADVVWSIAREQANSDGPLGFLDFAIKKIKADGDNAVVFTLSEPWAPFLSDISVFANAILPAKFGGKTEKTFFANPIGTGPWLLPSWTADSNLTLKKNPNYWQSGKPYLDSLTINYVSDQNQQILQLTGGQAQIIDNVPPSNVASLKGNSSVVVTEYPAWQTDILVLNEQLPQFRDVHVRRAIAYAIDTQKLVDATSFGTAKPATTLFPPSLQYSDPATPTLAYSITAAKAELAKSSYPHGFDTKLLISGGVQKWSEFAQIIQAALKPLNINVTITSLDHAAFEATFQKYDYDMFIDYAINDISDVDEMASFNLDYKEGGSKSYWSSYDNPKVIDLVHQAESEFDSPKRAAIYAQIQAIVAEDAPFVALDYPPYIYATSTNVKGFAVNPGGAYRLEDVWLA